MVLAESKICKFTLEISDKELAEQYKVRRFAQMNKISVAIAHSKVVYGMFIFYQFLKGSIGYKRPLVYHISTGIHYLMVKLFEK